MGIGAAVSAGSSLLGGLFGMNSANQASQAQQQAAQQALMAQMQMFQQSQKNLKPFIQGGQGFLNQLTSAMPGLTETFNPTMEQLAATPGYQWALNQGLQATQNSYASKGLGISGSALKGAGEYAQGLASQTYQQQLQNFMAQNLQKYNMLMGGSQLGANAAGGLASNAQATGQGLANTYTGLGNAQAAGQIGMGNALTGAVSGLGQYALMNQLSGGKLYGGNANMLANSGGANSGNGWSLFG